MIFKYLLLIITVCLSIYANAKPVIVTTLPEFAYIISEIARDKVEVKSLLNGTENPHYLDVRPDFISAIRKADLVCFSGLDLEVGWLPKSIEKSANSKIKPNLNGWCDIGSQVEAIDKINGKIDRSMGDVHAEGNPHYNLSLRQIRLSLDYITQKLTHLLPEENLFFKSNKEVLSKKLQSIDLKISKKFEELKQKNNGQLKFSQYHKEFSYLFKDYKIDESVSVEEKPGISPSAGRIRNVAQILKNENVNLVVGTDDAPLSTLQKLKETANVNYAILPRGFNLERNINDYEKLYVEIFKALYSSLKK